MKNNWLKIVSFVLGVILLVVSVIKPFFWSVDKNTLIVFGFLLLLAFFEDMEEFNFFGLKGKKTDKEMKKLLESISKTEQATDSSTHEDDLTKLRKKNIQLMGIDRGNFLALTFEVERLLRYVANYFYPDQVKEKTPLYKIIQLLENNNYLTQNGVKQVKALNEVRNLIVHGKVSPEEDNRLSEWIEVAYSLYNEISNDITSRTQVNEN